MSEITSNETETISYQDIDLKDSSVLQQVEEIEDAILEQQDVAVLWPDSPAFTIGAIDNGKLVGVTQVAKDGHINYIVHPSFQGRGIATNLLNTAITRSREERINNLVASVQKGSISERILVKAGFINSGNDKDIAYYSRKLDSPQ